VAFFRPNWALSKLKNTIINMLENVLALFRPNEALPKLNNKTNKMLARGGFL
jgi:hypothetical protein